MSKSDQQTIRIRWVRSGIAFNRNQKAVVRSLGLRRLHQVVERLDTPGVRGLVAKVAHLVEIVDGNHAERRSSVPEYTIKQAEPAAPESSAVSAGVAEEAESQSGSNL